MTRLPHTPPLLGALLLTLAAGACEQPRAHGDVNAIIIAAERDRWDGISEIVEAGLEPTIQTVRDERPFRLTYQDPEGGVEWSQLRRFRQVLVIGSPSEPWIEEALAARRTNDPVTPPTFVQVDNVWARGQTVSVIVLPEGGGSEALAAMVDTVRATLEAQYRGYATTRMYVSGRDTVLADSLAREVGFALTLPSVYRYSVRDSVFRFRNDNPSPTELIREIGVTWLEPAPDSLPGQVAMAEWRSEFANAYYNDPQDPNAAIETFRPIQVGDVQGVEYQSAWVSPEGAWPAGGPFIARAMHCPGQDRLYLLDAWLYAPTQAKYEYMIQLQTILDSFRCR